MRRELDVRRLISSARRIPDIERVETRDRYVRVLLRLSRDTTPLHRGATVDEDLEHIVRWCGRRPDGLRLLVDAITSVEGDSPAVDHLRHLVMLGEPAEHLLASERQLVAHVMSLLDRTTLARALAEALGGLNERIRESDSTPEEALRLLEDAIPRVGESHPLHLFLSRLVSQAPPDYADDLTTLLNAVADRTEAPRWEVELAPPVSVPRSYVLVVRLAEDARAPSRYILHVWLVSDEEGWTLRYTSDQPHFIEDIKTRLDELLLELSVDPEFDIGDLSIEFILPRLLLDHAVEMWEWRTLGQISRIGVDYPVVVRDLLRMRNRLVRDRWRRRCQSLQEPHPGLPSGSVRIVHFGPDDDHDEYGDLLRDPDRPICLVVSGEHAVDRLFPRLGGWLSAGVPVVVWCRDPRASSRFDANLPELLIDGGVRRLPTGVQQLRQDASGLGFPTSHVGMHITLLWDDERRRPPDEDQLRTPLIDRGGNPS